MTQDVLCDVIARKKNASEADGGVTYIFIIQMVQLMQTLVQGGEFRLMNAPSPVVYTKVRTSWLHEKSFP